MPPFFTLGVKGAESTSSAKPRSTVSCEVSHQSVRRAALRTWATVIVERSARMVESCAQRDLEKADGVLHLTEGTAGAGRDLVDEDLRIATDDALVTGLEQDATHRSGHAEDDHSDVVTIGAQLENVVVTVPGRRSPNHRPN